MAQFYTNEAVSLEKEVDNNGTRTSIAPDKFDWYYDIEKCTKWIKENDYKKVCLQFPDYLLGDSTKVCQKLQDQLNQRVYILGDTSYGSCCLDYVTAAHVEADALIHFGAKCFSEPSDRIPSLFINEKFDVNVDSLQRAFSELKSIERGTLVIVLDTPYTHQNSTLRNTFKSEVIIVIDELRQRKIDEDVVLYVGANDRKLLNFKLMFKDKVLYYYDGTGDSLKKYDLNNAVLKRRYFLIEKVKDSKTIGVVIGTVAVKNYMGVIDRMKKLFKIHGKKHYMISVGKPTVAKLANFPEMDVYVLIGCALNEMHDSKEFFRPILTPYDVETALNPRAAHIDFSYDFNHSISREDNDDLEGLEHSLVENDVSLLTGNVRCIQQEEVELGSGEVALRSHGDLVVSGGGAGFLAQRSWKGLQQNLGENEVKLAEDGRKGIAQGYSNEMDV